MAPVTNHLHSTPKSSGRFKSPLSKHLDVIPRPEKGTKTGTARVLTSAEWLEITEEKQRKKEQEAIQKEERKRERERKKIEREQLAQKRKEERLEQQKRRAEASLKKKEEIAAKKAARAAKTAKKSQGRPTTRARGRASGITRNASSTSVACESVSPTKAPQQSPPTQLPVSACSPPVIVSSSSLPVSATMPPPLASPPGSALPGEFVDKEAEDDYECAFCYSSYSTSDGRDWVKCACSRWVHEDCMEDVILDGEGLERFCPFCIN